MLVFQLFHHILLAVLEIDTFHNLTILQFPALQVIDRVIRFLIIRWHRADVGDVTAYGEGETLIDIASLTDSKRITLNRCYSIRNCN